MGERTSLKRLEQVVDFYDDYTQHQQQPQKTAVSTKHSVQMCRFKRTIAITAKIINEDEHQTGSGSVLGCVLFVLHLCVCVWKRLRFAHIVSQNPEEKYNGLLSLFSVAPVFGTIATKH